MKIGKPVFLKANPHTMLIEQHEFKTLGDTVEHYVNTQHRASIERKNFPYYVAALDCADECKFQADAKVAPKRK